MEPRHYKTLLLTIPSPSSLELYIRSHAVIQYLKSTVYDTVPAMKSGFYVITTKKYRSRFNRLDSRGSEKSYWDITYFLKIAKWGNLRRGRFVINRQREINIVVKFRKCDSQLYHVKT